MMYKTTIGIDFIGQEVTTIMIIFHIFVATVDEKSHIVNA